MLVTRYIWVEIVGRWPTADLFIGLFYLARQGLRDFPAKDVVANGRRVDPAQLSTANAGSLRVGKLLHFADRWTLVA